MTSSGQASGQPARQGRAARPALIVIAVCVVVGVLIGVRLAVTLTSAWNAPVLDVRTRHTAQLEPGTYAVFEHTGWKPQLTPADLATETLPRLGPADIRVTGPSGARLAVSRISGPTETITRDDALFRAVAHFTVVDAGPHEIVVTTMAPSPDPSS